MASNVARMIEVESLIFGDNVRTPECQQIPAMVESYKRHGFKVNHPLVVSEKSIDGETRFLVLCGNRRGLGLKWLRENDQESYARVLVSGKVPAIVHKGLTREEETELRIDHSKDEDRVPLDEWSIFQAIVQLVKSHIDTQERIAIKLGLFKTTGKSAGQPRREYVQVRVNLARLPAFVQDEFRKLTVDKDTTPLRWSKVTALYKVYNEEYASHRNGQGPKFQKLWMELITPPEATEANDDEGKLEPKELSPAEAVKRSQSASSDHLKTALLAVTRQSDTDLAELDAQMVAAESAFQTLREIKDYLGEKEFAELAGLASKQAAAQRQAEEVSPEAPAELVKA